MWLSNKKITLLSVQLCVLIAVTLAEDESWLVYTIPKEHQEGPGIVIRPLSKNATNETVIRTLDTPRGVTFDLVEKKIYWSTYEPLDILVANIDGTSNETLLDLIETEPTEGGRPREIRACNLRIQLCTVLVRDSNYRPYYIALHPQSGIMVWVNTGEIETIFKASMDGSNPTQIPAAANTNSDLRSIIVDHATSLLYWVDGSTERVHTSDFDGANLSTVESIGNASIEADSLAVLGPDIYWFDYRTDSIQKCNKYDGSLFKVEKSGLGLLYISEFFFEMFLMGPESQPKDRVNPCATDPCSHVCVLTETSYRCMCPDGLISSPDGRHCKEESWLVYKYRPNAHLSSEIAIRPLSQNGTNESRIRANHSVTALTFDLGEKKIYWSAKDTSDIFAASIYGTSSRTLLDLTETDTATIRGIPGLAMDWITGNLYLALEFEDKRPNEIRACNVRIQLCAVLVRDSNYRPWNIALHPQSGTMVWTNYDGIEIETIFKASMDGSNPTQVTAAVNTNSNLRSIVIDHALSRLFWVDGLTETVYTSDLDRPNVSTLGSIGNTSIQAYELAVLGPDIYWFDRSNDSIKKCNKHDGNLHEVEKSELPNGLDKMFLMGSGSQPNDRVNPCATHPCPYLCVLTETSYKCMCPHGLISYQDGQQCKDNGPKMLISATGGLRVLSLTTLKIQAIWNYSYSKSLSYDYKNSKIYWAGGEDGNTIFRSDLNGSGIESVVNISSSAGRFRIRIQGLAYDWIAHNIYYTTGHQIGVCDGSGINCAVLDDEKYSDEIALFPRSGLLFGSRATKLQMDGTSAKTTGNEIKNLDGLVIDNQDSLLYYREGQTVVTTDLDFQKLRAFVPDTKILEGFAVDGEWFYWMSDNILKRCQKNDCTRPKTVKQFKWDDLVWDMKLFHREGQLQDRINHCAGGLCSHICVLTRKYFRCICPTGRYLMDDSRNCTEFPGHGNFINSTKGVVDSYKQLIFKPEAHNGGRFGFGVSWKQWKCADGSFVDLADVCNGTLGCPDGTDESQYCDIPCNKINLTDDGTECLRTPNGPQIVCPKGYLPAADKATCEDVDECLHNFCDQDCINRNGSYECRDFPESSVSLGVALAAAIPAVVAIIAVIGIAIFFGVKYIQTRKILRKLTPDEVEEFLNGDENAANTADCGADKAMLMPFRLVIQPENIQIAKDAILGSGQFGVVYKGFYEGDAVAIKTFKRTVEIDEFKAVLAEAKIMAYIGDHENVVRFIGADVSSIADRKLVLVTELSPQGDLLGHLRKIEPSKWAQQINDTNPCTVSPTNLVEWCEQIACGMQYLEAVKIVHGDLAARNVLVFKNNVVKITDFGLSKQLYGNSEYMMKRQRKLPWKWCALELLTRLEFSTDSDIWAFGVTAWEIFSLGRQPYDQLALGPEFIQYLEQGQRLPKPTYATTGIYEILKSCWDVERSSRPRFAILREFFQEGSTKAVMNNHVDNWMASRVDYGYTKV